MSDWLNGIQQFAKIMMYIEWGNEKEAFHKLKIL